MHPLFYTPTCCVFRFCCYCDFHHCSPLHHSIDMGNSAPGNICHTTFTNWKCIFIPPMYIYVKPQNNKCFNFRRFRGFCIRCWHLKQCLHKSNAVYHSFSQIIYHLFSSRLLLPFAYVPGYGICAWKLSQSNSLVENIIMEAFCVPMFVFVRRCLVPHKIVHTFR